MDESKRIEWRWLVALVLGLVITFWLSGWLLLYLFPREHPAQRRSPSFESLQPDTRILVLGTSHVAFGVDPSLFDQPTVALAAGGLNYELMELVMKRALERATNINCVVIETDIISLRGDSVEKFNGDFSQVYGLGLSWVDLPRSWLWRLRQALRESPPLFPFFFAKRLLPRTFVWDQGGGEQLAKTADLVRGFVGATEVIEPWRDGAVVVGFHKEDLKPNRWQVNTAALLRMLDQLDREGRRVVLVRLPHHSTYLKAQPPEWEQQVEQLVATVRVRHPNVPFWDWMGAPGFEETEFADGHHLNVRGAERLTRMLVDQLRDGQNRERN